MRKHFLLPILYLFAATAAICQPSNDDCNTPINIPNVVNFCSAPGAYSSVGATPSTYGPANCFAASENDVWFSFTAQATDVTITVRGATTQAPGGTLQKPQIALYLGTCGGTINELGCESDNLGNDIIELYEGGLFVGSTYLIRIQGLNGNAGTFQICLNNYNPPVDPTSDCPTAAILCDKSPFVVQSVTGAGSNISELNDADCFNNGAPGNFESNSTWFVWTCSQSGTLTFTLTPLNVSDDLDFAIYRLPNGIGNCANKQLLRCMASGDFTYPSPCMGPTGLRPNDPDVSEDAGCNDSGDDAWLSPLDMVQGETYVLCVNNFTSTGNGFSIDFGGTGQFLGPSAQFTTVPQAVCLGTPVQVQDASSFPLGSITSWKWSFGQFADPLVATGPGPHTVTFNHPGINSVVLTVETNLGCKVTAIQSVVVYPDVKVDTVLAAPDCNGTANGAVEITNIQSGTPPYLFSWEGGPFISDNTLDSLAVGVYHLTIRDANNCETDLDIDVKERVLTAEPLVTPPLCFGDDNGIITLTVTNGKDPVQFDWGGGFIPNNSQGGFAAGSYTIHAVDAVLCEGTFDVDVVDHPPLALALDTIDITCFGSDNGMATASPSGGVGGFTYQWSNTQTGQTATDLAPGAYSVTATDANGCTITGNIFITEPPDMVLDLLDVVDLICNGLPEGEIRVEGAGGTPPYTFSPDGEHYIATDTLTGLLAGDYWIKIKDANGCIDSVFATIDQPPALQVIAEPADTTLELGFTVDVNTLTLPLGRPVTYSWSPFLGLSCTDCPEPTIKAIDDQLYVIQITDETGCLAYDTVKLRVNKNRPIYVPNIFKPEGSYENSRFTLFGGPAAQDIALLRIYDRWGELVFEANDIPIGDLERGWDGTYRGKLVEGVFAYYAYVRFIDQEQLLFEGDVTVLR